MMKKTLSMLFTLIFLLAGCNSKEKLYILKWNDSVSDEIIKNFENEHKVNVITEVVSTNEELYEKAKDNKYDIIFSKDYMVEKMIKDNFLKEIDKTLIDNSTYFIDVIDYHKQYDEDTLYSIPYTWGTLGLMYEKNLEDKVIENGWNILYDDIFGVNSVGLNESNRNIISSVLFYLNLDPNTKLDSDLSIAEAVLKSKDYTFASHLSDKVISGDLDVALIHSYEFFKEINKDELLKEEVGYFVPEKSNIWIDNIVIPKSSDKEITYDFINYITNVDNAYTKINSGYTPVDINVYKKLNEENNTYLINNKYFYPVNDDTTLHLYKSLDDSCLEKIDEIIRNVKH